MNVKIYCRVSAVIFTVVSLAHLTRLFYAWPIQVDGVVIPMWISIFGFIVTGGLAVFGFRESRN